MQYILYIYYIAVTIVIVPANSTSLKFGQNYQPSLQPA